VTVVDRIFEKQDKFFCGAYVMIKGVMIKGVMVKDVTVEAGESTY